MRRNVIVPVFVAITAMLFLQGASEGGCGQGLDNRPGEKGVDVGGATGAMWDVTYSDVLEVRVKNGAAVVATENITRAVGGTFDLDSVTVDLTKLCGRNDVACPDEVFPKQVKMTQPGSELHLLYVTFNKEGPLGSLNKTTLLGNVDSDHDFSIALGIGAAAAGTCGLLSVSYATGQIASNGEDPPVGTKFTGKIVTGYSGGCVLIGQTAGAGAGLTVEIKLPFTATRIM